MHWQNGTGRTGGSARVPLSARILRTWVLLALASPLLVAAPRPHDPELVLMACNAATADAVFGVDGTLFVASVSERIGGTRFRVTHVLPGSVVLASDDPDATEAVQWHLRIGERVELDAAKSASDGRQTMPARVVRETSPAREP